MSRISREELYMGIARLFSQRSTCVRGHVGCVAVVDNRIVAAGYNGAPSGMPQCDEVGCGGGVVVREAMFDTLLGGEVPRPAEKQTIREFPNGCTRSIHAELNMISFAAKMGVSLDGCTVFSTAGPCLPCAQGLISCGMAKLVYETPYRLPEGLKLVDSASIPAVKYEG